VIKNRRDGRAIQRSFETGSITEVLRRRTVVDVLRRAVGTPSQLERRESSVSLEATRSTESLFHHCSERNERVMPREVSNEHKVGLTPDNPESVLRADEVIESIACH
jgi:hypothetical protein